MANEGGPPGMPPPTEGMFDEKGMYLFNKREEREYHHDYSYLGGFLGEEEIQAKKKRERERGTLSMEPVLPPYDSAARKWIEQAAVHIMKTKDADNTELRWYTKDPNRNFFLQDIKDSDWKTSEEARQKRQGRSYYLFIKHCLDREVDFKPVVEEKIRIEIDRSAKLGVPMDGIATVGGSSGSADGPAAAEGSANGAAAAGGGAAANGTNGATIGDTAKRKGDPDGGEQKFDVGTRVEVLGLQAKPEHNGKEGVVLSFVAESGRFKVQLDEHGGITTLALKPGNLMYATKQKKEEKKWKHPIPKNSRVEIHGLKSESVQWLNGREGEVVDFDEAKGRYDVKIDLDKSIKQVKGDNLKVCLPEGWSEHYDEQFQKYYYVHRESGKISWKHPTARGLDKKETASSTAFTQGVTLVNEDLQKADFSRANRYKSDEGGEEGFDLKDLVRKVKRDEARRAKREAGEVVNTSDEDEELEEELDNEEEGGGAAGGGGGARKRKKKPADLRSKKKRKQDENQLFKPEVLLQKIEELQQKLASGGGAAEGGLAAAEQFAPERIVALSANKDAMQAMLQQKLHDLKQKAEELGAEERDQLISANPGASTEELEDASSLEFLPRSRLPGMLWQEILVVMLCGVKIMAKAFSVEEIVEAGQKAKMGSTSKHTIQGLNRLCIKLMEDVEEEDDEDRFKLSELIDKVDWLLGLFKVVLMV